jgi:hypothetical protein
MSRREIVPVLAAGLMFAPFCSCSAPHEETAQRASEDASPALPMLFGGCAEIWPHARCEPDGSGAIVIFVESAEPANIVVQVDGEIADVTRESFDGGTRLRVALPANARTVSVESRGQRATLRIEPVLHVPALHEARTLRGRGELAEARALLMPLLASSDPRARVRARSLSARVSLSAGDLDAALEGLAASSEEAERYGMLHTAAVDATIRAELLRSRALRLADADVALRASAPGPEAGALANALARYHSGLVARDRGDRRNALSLLRESIWLARAAGEDGLASDAELVILPILVDLGRTSEARAALTTRLAGESGSTCEHADLREHEAWIELASGNLARARAALIRARTILDEGCSRVGSRANVAVDLALVALREGAFEEARRWLEQAHADGNAPALALAYALEVEAQLALRRGNSARALQLWDELHARARVAGAPALEYLAVLGRGRALIARRQHADAAIVLADAEALLDAEAIGVPLGEGREAFLARRGESAEALVEVLLVAGRPRDAMNAARRARRRALISLSSSLRVERLGAEERRIHTEALSSYRRAREDRSELEANAWAVPREDLAAHVERLEAAQRRTRAALDRALAQGNMRLDAPLVGAREGELSVVITRVALGWVALADDGVEVSAIHVDDIDGGTSSEILARIVRELGAKIAVARSLRWMPSGALAAIDPATVIIDGDPLPLRIPMVHGIDVPMLRPRGTGNRALVVSDPTGDLASAQREGEFVARALSTQNLAITALHGSEATYAAVIGALGQARMAWWAGHGEVGGRDGIESALPLAETEILEASDVLALPRVPDAVVLLGCETARATEAGVAGLGLAQAFVIAGSSAVLATSRTIDDADAARIAEALLAERNRGADAPLFDAASVASASRRLRAEGIEAWSALRLLVP